MELLDKHVQSPVVVELCAIKIGLYVHSLCRPITLKEFRTLSKAARLLILSMFTHAASMRVQYTACRSMEWITSRGVDVPIHGARAVVSAVASPGGEVAARLISHVCNDDATRSAYITAGALVPLAVAMRMSKSPRDFVTAMRACLRVRTMSAAVREAHLSAMRDGVMDHMCAAFLSEDTAGIAISVFVSHTSSRRVWKLQRSMRVSGALAHACKNPCSIGSMCIIARAIVNNESNAQHAVDAGVLEAFAEHKSTIMNDKHRLRLANLIMSSLCEDPRVAARAKRAGVRIRRRSCDNGTDCVMM